LAASSTLRAVSELPLATRNFTQILGLSPGQPSIFRQHRFGPQRAEISVNGARHDAEQLSINGVDATTYE